MKKTLIYLNLFIANFLFWYFIVRITGDTHLNAFLDALIKFAINNIQMAIALVIGLFVPLDKAKEIVGKFKTK